MTILPGHAQYDIFTTNVHIKTILYEQAITLYKIIHNVILMQDGAAIRLLFVI